MIVKTASVAVLAAMAFFSWPLPASTADIQQEGRLVEIEVSRFEAPGSNGQLNEAERILLLRDDAARLPVADLVLLQREWQLGSIFLEERRLNR